MAAGGFAQLPRDVTGAGLSTSLFNPPSCPREPRPGHPLSPASGIPGAQRTRPLGELLGPDAGAGRVHFFSPSPATAAPQSSSPAPAEGRGPSSSPHPVPPAPAGRAAPSRRRARPSPRASAGGRGPAGRPAAPGQSGQENRQHPPASATTRNATLGVPRHARRCPFHQRCQDAAAAPPPHRLRRKPRPSRDSVSPRPAA